LAASACAPRSSSPPRDPNLLFTDDFSKADSGWDTYTGAEGAVAYDNGQYLIRVDEPQLYLWGTPGLNLTDAAIEGEATYAAGPVNNEFGVMCRFAKNGDQSSFYFFVISSDGYYASGKVVKDKLTYLDPKDFQASSAISTDPAAVHHLAATCQGNKLSFSLNGVPLAAFEDSDLKRGDAGLIVGTFDEAGASLHFDNVVIRKP
jgi:hypothetical protein